MKDETIVNRKATMNGIRVFVIKVYRHGSRVLWRYIMDGMGKEETIPSSDVKSVFWDERVPDE